MTAFASPTKACSLGKHELALGALREKGPGEISESQRIARSGSYRQIWYMRVNQAAACWVELEYV